jgi:hypothetical protein
MMKIVVFSNIAAGDPTNGLESSVAESMSLGLPAGRVTFGQNLIHNGKYSI